MVDNKESKEELGEKEREIKRLKAKLKEKDNTI